MTDSTERLLELLTSNDMASMTVAYEEIASFETVERAVLLTMVTSYFLDYETEWATVSRRKGDDWEKAIIGKWNMISDEIRKTKVIPGRTAPAFVLYNLEVTAVQYRFLLDGLSRLPLPEAKELVLSLLEEQGFLDSLASVDPTLVSGVVACITDTPGADAGINALLEILELRLRTLSPLDVEIIQAISSELGSCIRVKREFGEVIRSPRWLVTFRRLVLSGVRGGVEFNRNTFASLFSNEYEPGHKAVLDSTWSILCSKSLSKKLRDTAIELLEGYLEEGDPVHETEG